MPLKVSSFFHYHMFHPLSPDLSRAECVQALIASFTLAIFFGGLVHAACALLFRNYKHIPPGTTTPETAIFQRTVVVGPPKTIYHDIPSSSEEPVFYKSTELEAGKDVHHFRTEAGGSCAFHALFGSWNGEMYAHQEVEALRNGFIAYLRESKTLPPEIPNAFAVYTSEDPEKTYSGYFEHLQNLNTYLLQDELMAVADWQEITVELIQPGWGNDKDKIQSKVLNPGHSQQITVYYDGSRHYERAEVVHSNDIAQSELA